MTSQFLIAVDGVVQKERNYPTREEATDMIRRCFSLEIVKRTEVYEYVKK